MLPAGSVVSEAKQGKDECRKNSRVYLTASVSIKLVPQGSKPSDRSSSTAASWSSESGGGSFNALHLDRP